MTTNYTLYTAILDILRKDERGEAVSVKEFNVLLPVVSHEYFAQQYEKFQRTQNITDSLAPFISSATVALTAGAGTLPADYFHVIGEPTYTQTISTVDYIRRIDIVTEAELAYRRADPNTEPTLAFPVAVIRANAIQVYPTTITSVSLTYFKDPVTPKLDYYLTTATNVRTFLAAAATHVVLSGESYPIASTAPGVGSTYTSLTVEMEWLAQDRPSLLYLFLSKLGVTMSDQLVAEYSINQQQKENRA